MHRAADEQPPAGEPGADAGDRQTGFRQVNAGHRERRGQRQPVVHDDARQDIPGPGGERIQEPFELTIRRLPVAQLEKVHPERAQFEEMVRREPAHGADRAGDGAPRRSQAD